MSIAAEGQRGPNALPQPAVSVVLVCRNERDFVEHCLENLRRQVSVPDFYEIIVADGCSDDGTADIVKGIAQGDNRIRLVENPQKIVPTGLNAGIIAARGNIIVRADAHAEYAPDYVAQCVEALLASGADNVGGPARTRAKSYFQAANSAAYHSPFSVGGARFHDTAFEGFVDTVPFGCWWKSRLLEIGLFDEALVRNQDDDLNYRIRRAGGRIWQTPKIALWYYPRKSPGSLFRQYLQYGYWKVRLLRKYRTPTTFRQLAPVSALAALVSLLVASIFSHAAFIALVVLVGSYIVISMFASLRAASSVGRWDLLFVLPFVFSVYHLSYGLGFAAGLFEAVTGRASHREAASRLTR